MTEPIRPAPWRFVTGRRSYADFSISVSPAIERAVAERTAAPTVYLNVFDSDSITIGVNEDPHQVLDLDFCHSRGVTALRRTNGGGAIYAGRGSAFLALYLPLDAPHVPPTAADAFPVVLGHVADSLRERFGLAAAYRPLNDVEMDGRKLVATSVKIEDGVLTFRILLNVTEIDTDIAACALPMPPEKVRDKKHKDLGSRYTFLERELGRGVTHDELVHWAQDVTRRAFGDVVLQPGELVAREVELAAGYASRLASDAWFTGKSEAVRYAPLMREGDRIGRGREKAPAGMIWLSVLVRDNTIVRAIVNGDWHPRPIRSIEWLEDGFAGLPAERSACERHIEAFLARGDVEFAGLEASHLTTALERALATLADPST
ncbi:lipoate--protein ligase family protein [Burkholderia pyrrocinia]|uniref:lipoate--protein ligase family protein n=1 Tax=Burkholderia pyrrocinia TaxID=60550 RepID=UPI001BCF6183|nr:hypothetical protein [Burkholderia pyrrocinia]QVN23134.1 lipoate--protein ligase family protein [Burkholderia pyrrocinia]